MIGRNRALDVLLALNLIDELNLTLDNIFSRIKPSEHRRQFGLNRCVGRKLVLEELDHWNPTIR